MKISKIISMICLCAIIGSFGTVLAASAEKEAVTITSDVVVERVDVPLSAALADANFSAFTFSKDDPNKDVMQPLAITWNVWGEKSLTPSTHLYKPVGYSEHKNGSTVLETYHYTRTFLGSSTDPRGDSGRVWGNYTVKATGTDCLQDVWDVFIHRVYYGTTTD